MATLNDPIIIEEHRIAFEIPEVPFNTSGGAGDVYLGVHDTVGQVAVKRLRFSNETSNDEDAIRVSESLHVYLTLAEQALISDLNEKG